MVGDMLVKLYAFSGAVFILNDLIWLTQPTYVTFTLADWAIRIIVIGVLLSCTDLRAVGRGRSVSDSGFVYRLRLRHFFTRILWPTFLCVILVGEMNHQTAAHPIFRLFSLPEPTNWPLHLVDASLGLFLVTVSETLAFIVLPILIQQRKGWPIKWVVTGACLVFGIAHWSMGLIDIVFIAFIQAVFFWVAYKTRSFGTVMLVHYYVDFHHLVLMPFLNGRIISSG